MVTLLTRTIGALSSFVTTNKKHYTIITIDNEILTFPQDSPFIMKYHFQ